MMRLGQALGGGCVALVAEIERRRCRGSCQAQGSLRGRGGGSRGDAQWGASGRDAQGGGGGGGSKCDANTVTHRSPFYLVHSK